MNWKVAGEMESFQNVLGTSGLPSHMIMNFEFLPLLPCIHNWTIPHRKNLNQQNPFVGLVNYTHLLVLSQKKTSYQNPDYIMGKGQL